MLVLKIKTLSIHLNTYLCYSSNSIYPRGLNIYPQRILNYFFGFFAIARNNPLEKIDQVFGKFIRELAILLLKLSRFL